MNRFVIFFLLFMIYGQSNCQNLDRIHFYDYDELLKIDTNEYSKIQAILIFGLAAESFAKINFYKFNNLEYLDIEGCNLRNVYDWLSDCKKIVALKLRFNGLVDCPTFSANKALEIIDLSDNRIANIDTSLYSIPHLRGVYFSNNRIFKLDEKISKLNKLEYIDLRWNPLKKIDGVIIELCKNADLKELYLPQNSVTDSIFYGIKLLKNINTLDISYNKAISLCGVSILSNPFLKVLHLNYCELSKKKNDIFPNLPSVEEMSLAGNDLRCLPTLDSLPNLHELNLSYNSFSSIPQSVYYCENLRILNLENNEISDIDSGISKLRNLKVLLLFGNPIARKKEKINKLKELLPKCNIIYLRKGIIAKYITSHP